MRIFSGIQPTGQLHLGNYLGAIKQWVSLQEQGDCLFCIVDLHAISMPQDPKQLRKSILHGVAAYIACGIDPEKCTIFPQSQVIGHTELSWILGCLTPMGWLNRMTQFKDKAGKNREKVGLGLYAYPVLQAADILLYKATHVPVGEDQKQHLELTRDIARVFNRYYDDDFFPLPEPMIIGNAARIMSLRDGNKKMSKSDPSDFSRIHLNDSMDIVAKKIRKAKTDPEPLPGHPKDLESRAEARNLLSIYAAFAGQTLDDVCQSFEGQLFSRFKQVLCDIVIEKLAPIQKEIHALEDDQAYLEQVLAKGAHDARARARPILEDVYHQVGFSVL